MALAGAQGDDAARCCIPAMLRAQAASGHPQREVIRGQVCPDNIALRGALQCAAHALYLTTVQLATRADAGHVQPGPRIAHTMPSLLHQQVASQ
jgi:hypothetical protein